MHIFHRALFFLSLSFDYFFDAEFACEQFASVFFVRKKFGADSNEAQEFLMNALAPGTVHEASEA